jgi:hypothetical protein
VQWLRPSMLWSQVIAWTDAGRLKIDGALVATRATFYSAWCEAGSAIADLEDFPSQSRGGDHPHVHMIVPGGGTACASRSSGASASQTSILDETNALTRTTPSRLFRRRSSSPPLHKIASTIGICAMLLSSAVQCPFTGVPSSQPLPA